MKTDQTSLFIIVQSEISDLALRDFRENLLDFTVEGVPDLDLVACRSDDGVVLRSVAD